MKKMTAVMTMILFSALSSQAAEVTRCFDPHNSGKGYVAIDNSNITVNMNVQFNSKGEVEISNLNNQSFMTDYEVDNTARNDGSSISVIGDARLIGYDNSIRVDDNNRQVRVTVDEGFVSFQLLPFGNEPIGELVKYPVATCR